MRLASRLVPIAEVTRGERAQMFALMDRYYENVARARFEADLEEKQWVILVVDSASGNVRGFSTQVLLDAAPAGRPIRALFSGDTIVARDIRGQNPLAHEWGLLALALIDAHPGTELFWFLISKGYKTYRFLPVFFHEFYPCCTRPAPGWARAAIDDLGRSRFPGSYDARAGLVKAGPHKDRLRPGVADVAPRRLLDPHVRFFIERNPGHAAGDELCCIAPLTRANFTPAAWRVIGSDALAAR